MIGSTELCRVCGLPHTTLNTWIEQGYLVPSVVGGRGRGNSHKFTTTQAVGIGVATKLAESHQGCRNEYVKQVVQGFAQMPEEALAQARRTRKDAKQLPVWFMGLTSDGEPILTRCDYDWQVNALAIYAALKDLEERNEQLAALAGSFGGWQED